MRLDGMKNILPDPQKQPYSQSGQSLGLSGSEHFLSTHELVVQKLYSSFFLAQATLHSKGSVHFPAMSLAKPESIMKDWDIFKVVNVSLCPLKK